MISMCKGPEGRADSMLEDIKQAFWMVESEEKLGWLASGEVSKGWAVQNG